MNLKQYTPHDLRLMLTLLPVLEQEATQAKEKIKQNPRKLFETDNNRYYWCHLYEMPFLEHLVLCITEFGFLGDLETLKSPDAVARSIEEIHNMDYELEESKNDDPFSGTSVYRAYVLLTSITFSMRSLLVYGYYLNDLVIKVREGDDDALFNAVRIDPTVIGSPSIISRISQAILISDENFMNDLKNALEGKLGSRESKTYQKMRFVLQVLLETGAERLTNDQLYELFVKELEIYSPHSEGGDVKRNLRKFAKQYMEEKAST